MGRSCLSRMLLALVLVFVCHYGVAQMGTNTNNPTDKPASPSPVLPLTRQFRKTVVFLQTDCLHDYTQEVQALTPEVLAKLKPEEIVKLKQTLITVLQSLSRIQLTRDKVELAKAKLTPDEISLLKPEILVTLDPTQMEQLLLKMTSLTYDDISQITAEQLKSLPTDPSMGTGFFVEVSDGRLPAGNAFHYLVTNRHVVEPGIDIGKPCKVILNSSVLLRRKNSANTPSTSETVNLGNHVPWKMSSDDSVDLAVVPFTQPPDVAYDLFSIPLSVFITEEMVQQSQIVEGDSLLFTGLFIQTFKDSHTLEPIVRSGTLAMIPEGMMITTLHKPGRIYFAQIHAFHGNSGSPVFIDTNGFTNRIGFSYKFLGVISGEVPEDADFNLQVTTTYAATVAANSDISTVVPAEEVRKILFSPALQKERDDFIATQSHGK
jgi:hypothetical protein